MPIIATKRTAPHQFVPDNLKSTDTEALAGLFDRLESRDLSTRKALEEYIRDWDELNGFLYEARTTSYVDMTADTANPAYEAAYTEIIEKVMPLWEQRTFKLKQTLLASPALGELGDEYSVFLRHVRAEVELFREENVPLMSEERALDQEFQKISGAQTAQFQGETVTLPQLQAKLEETDRKTREEAWRARMDARLADADALDDLFDRMYSVRTRIARNAGFDNYRDYKFKELRRFDYTPEDCLKFHAAIEKRVVPVATRNNERRKRLLGLDTLRPWDMQVDPENHEPLRPYKEVEELKEGCERIFRRIDPELADLFRTMINDNQLDLENRPGKAPGGYMDSFTDTGASFIFMNAVGTHRDVETLLHEGGHAFHYMLSRKQPLVHYQMFGVGAEIAEVASMSMEYLSLPYLGEFYGRDEIARINDFKIRDSFVWLPFISMIDAFQNWFYTAEKNGSQERKAKWAELEARFRPDIDWTGLEQYRDIGWQYLHIFSYPFYYIEYAIAQLAAMRIWLNSLENERDAVQAYKQGLSLGGSRPLPELFQTVGAHFGLDDPTVSAIVEGALAQMAAED